MTRLSIKWTKPATKKLRKKNAPPAFNVPDYSRSNTMSRLEERIDNHDGWSVVSAPRSPRGGSDDFEEVSEDTGLLADYSAISEGQQVQQSESPTWSFIDFGPGRNPGQESPELDYDDCLIHPVPDADQYEPYDAESLLPPQISVNPPTPSCQDATNDSPTSQEQDPLPAHLVDYRGARSYWNQPVDLDDLGEQIKQIKNSYRDLSGKSRELFKKQEKQLSDLQNARWEIEASRDEVEKHVDELREERAQMRALDLKSKTTPAPLNIERKRDIDLDSDTRSFLERFNARERAIFSTIGTHAQRSRPPRQTQQPRIEHAKSNFTEDFPYKTGTFIHRDIRAIYDHHGMRVGWYHEHMPSYKKVQQPTSKPCTKDEVLKEIGEMPVSERMEALFGCQKFKQAVSRTEKGRKRQTKWYTERTMASLLWREMVARESRHDSMLDED
ncbi:hypothetical protein PRZ48_002197 [Zasmidium cellare]|uniref:Uncharacterized protein n=1 Tax=Zasmidium cellare TaxID=395010 RepID=A0ABR0F4Q7_ZASCE|nr:hypothetical protein PRZ48_002197 [Zasmidium cellare]